MFELPLFPLSTVLFPGMPLPLRIFEKRYKKMVAYCLAEQRPFGVVFIREGVAERGPLADPYQIGCTADILRTEPLANDQMIIITVGRERFRITELQHDQPYLVGIVENAPLFPEPDAMLSAEADHLYPLVVSYLHKLQEIGEIEFDPTELPTDTEKLIYIASALLQVPQIEKQALLETDRPSWLLRDLLKHYRQELDLMRFMPKTDQGLFSIN